MASLAETIVHKQNTLIENQSLYRAMSSVSCVQDHDNKIFTLIYRVCVLLAAPLRFAPRAHVQNGAVRDDYLHTYVFTAYTVGGVQGHISLVAPNLYLECEDLR
jgi:hypothetical protein